MISPHKLFTIYTPIRLHFANENFDALKYGISNFNPCTVESFRDRPDKKYFDTWGVILNDTQQALDYCLFNFANGNEHWLYHEQHVAKDVYLKGKGYFASLTRNIKEESKLVQKTLDEKNIKFKSIINITEKGNRPPLLQMVLKGNISREFICLIDNGFLDKWSEWYDKDPFISREMMKLRKYKQFVKIISKRILSGGKEIQ